MNGLVVPDFSDELSRTDETSDSSSGHPLEQRIGALTWRRSLNWQRHDRILLIDDLLSRGRSAVPLMANLRQKRRDLGLREPHFTLSVPVWVADVDGAWISQMRPTSL